MTKKAVYVVQSTDEQLPKSIGEKKPDLKELQSHVGGYIQVLPGRLNDRSCSIVINEEGKLYNFPKNPLATKLWHDFYKWKYKAKDHELEDHIVGPAVILEGYRL